MARKEKASDHENRGTGAPKKNGENHNQSNPGRNSGGRGNGGKNG